MRRIYTTLLIILPLFTKDCIAKDDITYTVQCKIAGRTLLEYKPYKVDVGLYNGVIKLYNKPYIKTAKPDLFKILPANSCIVTLIHKHYSE